MRSLAALAAVALCALLLAGCGSSTPVSMQLPAETSVGTGALADAWASAILADLGAPAGDTPSMIAWFSAEDGGHPAGQHTDGAGENNPLNLTADSGEFSGVTGTEPSGAGPAIRGTWTSLLPLRACRLPCLLSRSGTRRWPVP